MRHPANHTTKTWPLKKYQDHVFSQTLRPTVQKDFLLELLSESRELLFQVGDFFLEDCDIAFQARDLFPHG